MKNKRLLLLVALTLFTLLGVNTQMLADNVLKVEINKGWTFKQVRGNNWYPATVPGVVQTDLMANKIIDDPYFRLNERKVQWVDKEDWEYKTTIEASPALLAKQNIELKFMGLDTYADVYLNDECLLKANNMFREWTVDVKDKLKAGKNELRIYFNSPIKVGIPLYDKRPYHIEAGNDQSENGGILDKKVSVFERKAGYHFGWDWGPRLVTSGIWRPIYLRGWDEARLDNVFYEQTNVTTKQADINVISELVSDGTGEATIHVMADGVKETWETKATLHKGINQIRIPIQLKKPKLWWSNGLGDPHRYTFTTKVEMNGKVLDSKTEKIGVRSMKIINKKDAFGHTFYVELNGKKVFAKGANYIPQDNFLPRVTYEKNKKTILDAVHANMNMLRVWGGGIYEYDAFYDLCDEYGIMIWQDFMFGCSTYPIDEAQKENIRQEAIDNVKRIRNHACIALWVGNNEMHTAWFNWGWWNQYKEMGTLEKARADYKVLFHEVLPKVMEDLNPVAFYWPSSPYGGDPDKPSESGKPNWNPNGDGHYWGVWHGKDSIANFNVMRARFFSEYGFQSFPEYQSVLKYAPEKRDHSIYSEVMMHHQRGGSHANKLIEWYLLSEYRKPKDFQNFLYMGQLLQGDAIKTAMEAHRRDMPYCMGTLFWQHNDCWPVASWSSRDYYGRWKAQHYFAKKAYRNILVSPIKNQANLDVYIVSDFLESKQGVLDIRILDLQGNKIYQKKKKVSVPADASKVQYSEKLTTLLKGKAENEVVVNVRFTDRKTKEVYENNYYLTRYKNIDFPKATIDLKTVAKGDGYEVTVSSDVVARGVFLSTQGIDNFFSDNYFDVLPDEPVTIHVTTKLNKADFDAQLKSESISDAY